MAKKKKTAKTGASASNTDIVKFCAFWGLVIAAITALVSFVLALLGKCGIPIGWAGRAIGVCNTISQIALLVAVVIPAYRFVCGKRTIYKSLFWFAVIMLVLGLVGINLAF